MRESCRRFEPPGVAVAVTGLLTVGAVALTESFAELPPAVTAYVAAWWVLGLGQGTPTEPRETR
ncbi:MAG: hypothetical protein JWN91_424 [Nocardioides sp.]|nr:hypothetical protein [Nocardioides sp.]